MERARRGNMRQATVPMNVLSSSSGRARIARRFGLNERRECPFELRSSILFYMVKY
jgi:hypothetical protein